MQIVCPKCREKDSDLAVFCHLKTIVLDPRFALRFYCENDHVIELIFDHENGETNLRLENV